MKIIHFNLKPRSPAATPWRGDTLMGHILWMFAYQKGEDALRDLLQGIPENPPPAVSDLFPEGMLPVPVLSIPKDEVDKLEYAGQKRLKKIKFLDTEEWKDLRKDLNPYSYFLALEAAEKENERKEKTYEGKKDTERDAILHATINRLTGTTGEEVGGLYAREVIYYAEDYRLHGYLAPGILGDDAFNLLEEVGRNGYGADASTGMGQFDIEKDNDFNSEEFLHCPDANGFMALSRCLPDEQCKVMDSSYATEIHYGRLGGSFANWGNPFKKPVIMMQAGSLFKPIPGGDKCPGYMLENVACGHSEPIKQMGFTIPYYCKWTDKEEVK